MESDVDSRETEVVNRDNVNNTQRTKENIKSRGHFLESRSILGTEVSILHSSSGPY